MKKGIITSAIGRARSRIEVSFDAFTYRANICNKFRHVGEIVIKLTNLNEQWRLRTIEVWYRLSLTLSEHNSAGCLQ